MYFSTLPVLVAPLVLSKALAGWSVAIYSSGDSSCAGDSSYSSYSGDGQSSCFEAGTDGDPSCTFFTDGGITSNPCTAPMSPIGDSISVSVGSSCGYWLNTAGLGSGGCVSGGQLTVVFAFGPSQEGTCQATSSLVPGGPAPGSNWYFQCHDF